MIKVVESAEPPIHLFFGRDAYDLAQAKIKMVEKDLETWKKTRLSSALEINYLPFNASRAVFS